MSDVAGITVLVCGAGSTLAPAVLRDLARKGAVMLAADSDQAALERAVEQLAEPDEISTHLLKGADGVSRWDLANLVAACLPSVNVLVHVAGRQPAIPVRTLDAAATRAAREATTESLMTAIARLEKSLVQASEEDAFGTRVVAVAPVAEAEAAAASLCFAATAALAASLSAAYREARRLWSRRSILQSGSTDDQERACAGALHDSRQGTPGHACRTGARDEGGVRGRPTVLDARTRRCASRPE